MDDGLVEPPGQGLDEPQELSDRTDRTDARCDHQAIEPGKVVVQRLGGRHIVAPDRELGRGRHGGQPGLVERHRVESWLGGFKAREGSHAVADGELQPADERPHDRRRPG